MEPAKTIDHLIQRDAITAALDVEHGAIEESLQALITATHDGAGPAVLTQILDQILGFCSDHFRGEEQFFQKHGVARFEAHIGSHEELLRRLRIVRIAMAEGNIDAAAGASELLNAFHKHVAHFDHPDHVRLLWRHVETGCETTEHVNELVSLDRLGDVVWNDDYK